MTPLPYSLDFELHILGLEQIDLKCEHYVEFDSFTLGRNYDKSRNVFLIPARFSSRVNLQNRLYPPQTS